MENNESIASPKEEASKEKPDFEKMVRDVFTGRGMRLEESYVLVGTAFAESIWNDHVEPRDKQIAALQEEIRQLKKSEKQLLVEYTRFLRQMNYFNKSPKNIMAGYVGEFQQCQLKNKQ